MSQLGRLSRCRSRSKIVSTTCCYCHHSLTLRAPLHSLSSLRVSINACRHLASDPCELSDRCSLGTHRADAASSFSRRSSCCPFIALSDPTTGSTIPAPIFELSNAACCSRCRCSVAYVLSYGCAVQSAWIASVPVWDEDSCAPKKPCIRCHGVPIPQGKRQF